MPPGAKKRKAAKKKKVNDSSTTNPHQAVVVEKKEDGLTENKANDNIEIEIGSKSKSSSSSDSSDDESRVVEKNVVVFESAPSGSAVEFVPEKISPIVDPVKNVDSLLEEVSQVFDEIENEKKKDLVVKEQTVVVSKTDMKDDCLTSSVVAESVKENEVENVLSFDKKASLVSKDDVSSSTPPKSLISEVKGADHANGTDTNGHSESDKQAPAASPAVSAQNTTTWKSCCGIFELFSGSER